MTIEEYLRDRIRAMTQLETKALDDGRMKAAATYTGGINELSELHRKLSKLTLA